MKFCFFATALLSPLLVSSSPISRRSTCSSLFTLTAVASNSSAAYDGLTVQTNSALWLADAAYASELYEGPSNGTLPIAHFYQNDTDHLYATGFDLYETTGTSGSWTTLPPPFQVMSFYTGDAFISDTPPTGELCTITKCYEYESTAFAIEDDELTFTSADGGVNGFWACPDGSYDGLWEIKVGAANFVASNLDCEEISLQINYIDATSADVCSMIRR